MEDAILKDFYGKEVTLLLDARQCSYPQSGGQSLEAIARISASGAQDVASQYLRVDSIRYILLERSPEERAFGNGAVQKDYIVGIFTKK
ncbi:hypothetical protein HYW21_01670 [Candidatus Woesearchaeota archaeon]|nr:hypothetical protein [Candidatus Woesearchaeota archaeon]